jgi:hypothetical protein
MRCAIIFAITFFYNLVSTATQKRLSQMADEGQETPVVAPPKTYPVTSVTTLEDFQARIAVQERVTAVLFTAKDGGATSGQSLSAYELISDEADFANTISFLHVDVAVGREISKAAKVCALPTTQFYFNGAVIEEFSGNNAEKVRLMAKNAVARRVELIKEAEARAVAAAAAAAEESEAVAAE